MLFRFRPYPAVPPSPSAGGAAVSWRPIISLGVCRAGGGPRNFCDAHVDTGADDVLLPLGDAKTVGIDLSRAVVRRARTATGTPFVIRYADAELTLAMSAVHFVRWRAVVGFADITNAVFGFAGGLQYFHASFDWSLGRFALVPYPDIPLIGSSFPGPDAALQVPV